MSAADLFTRRRGWFGESLDQSPTHPLQEPEAGRCARCKCNTVLERLTCDDCQAEDGAPCSTCKGRGYTESTPCCGVSLIDEAAEVDAAYDRLRDEAL